MRPGPGPAKRAGPGYPELCEPTGGEDTEDPAVRVLWVTVEVAGALTVVSGGFGGRDVGFPEPEGNMDGGEEPPVVPEPVGVAGTSDWVEDTVGDEVTLGAGEDDEPVPGRVRGPWGWSTAGPFGSRNKPTVSPATRRTEPPAAVAARSRRRARTPSRRRSRCSDAKGMYSWESRIIRANSCSKWSMDSLIPPDR
ncbi:hypothetical protein ABZ876_15230 [Streptomyces sp. NPDC046931]|uniref:hypothetical protein n=1 Tax=Streptomyces sp. NPDC046931 TaxID=3154806 RepID=UPI0033FF80EE